jgi:hypothetical protein
MKTGNTITYTRIMWMASRRKRGVICLIQFSEVLQGGKSVTSWEYQDCWSDQQPLRSTSDIEHLTHKNCNVRLNLPKSGQKSDSFYMYVVIVRLFFPLARHRDLDEDFQPTPHASINPDNRDCRSLGRHTGCLLLVRGSNRWIIPLSYFLFDSSQMGSEKVKMPPNRKKLNPFTAEVAIMRLLGSAPMSHL